MAQASNTTAVKEALSQIVTGVFILTACFEDRRMGVVVGPVQRVSVDPPMVCVAVRKGEPIMPLISDSRRFGLCQLGEKDAAVKRRFSREVEEREDVFLGVELVRCDLTNLPLLAHTMAHLECELMSHFDVEGDHDLFIGRVRSGGVTKGRGKAMVE